MFLEDDTAYLDEASSAPAVPGGLPGDTDTSSSRTKVCYSVWYIGNSAVFR